MSNAQKISCSQPPCTQFLLEPEWTFAPNLKKLLHSDKRYHSHTNGTYGQPKNIKSLAFLLQSDHEKKTAGKKIEGRFVHMRTWARRIHLQHLFVSQVIWCFLSLFKGTHSSRDNRSAHLVIPEAHKSPSAQCRLREIYKCQISLSACRSNLLSQQSNADMAQCQEPL